MPRTILTSRISLNIFVKLRKTNYETQLAANLSYTLRGPEQSLVATVYSEILVCSCPDAEKNKDYRCVCIETKGCPLFSTLFPIQQFPKQETPHLPGK